MPALIGKLIGIFYPSVVIGGSCLAVILSLLYLRSQKMTPLQRVSVLLAAIGLAVVTICIVYTSLFDRKFLPALPDLIRLLWILGAWTVVSFDAYALLRRVPGFLKAIDQMNWSVVKNGASA